MWDGGSVDRYMGGGGGKLLQEHTPHVDDPLCLHLESLRDLWYCVVTMIVNVPRVPVSITQCVTDDGD